MKKIIKEILSKNNKILTLIIIIILLLTSMSIKNIVENYNSRDTNAKMVNAGTLSNTE